MYARMAVFHRFSAFIGTLIQPLPTLAPSPVERFQGAGRIEHVEPRHGAIEVVERAVGRQPLCYF